MTILFHTSKTMNATKSLLVPQRNPSLIKQAKQLGAYIQTLSSQQLAKSMHISESLAEKTIATMQSWKPEGTTTAIHTFRGDMYSGLQADKFSKEDLDYADSNLFILSGLYGVIRPYDSIVPYRLEMGYKFPDAPYNNLYNFWGNSIEKCLPSYGPIINNSSDEYTKCVLPFVDKERVFTPKFLTINPVSKQPTFVVVHSKIARGAFARWLIINRIKTTSQLSKFDSLGYKYDASTSTEHEPSFICKEFGGIGLSIRMN